MYNNHMNKEGKKVRVKVARIFCPHTNRNSRYFTLEISITYLGRWLNTVIPQETNHRVSSYWYNH